PVEQSRQAAEKATADAAKAAEPKNLNVTQPVPPIVIVVKPAPVKLDVKLSAGEVKRGGSVEVAVNVTRQNHFTGPVNVSLSSPQSGKNVLATELTVPADATSAVFRFTVGDEAAIGEIPHLVVRAIAEQDGEAVVEAPVTLKIVE
ncbi:MAG: hypothetical protein KF861_14660, partial [Planctomycetaceae bacterium]|nr:hypothetical protein [Planctomycetaceae bacterium]